MDKAEISAIPDMAALRAAINALDLHLAERMLRIGQTARIKATAALPVRIGSRLEDVAARARRNAVAPGCDPDMAEGPWRLTTDHFIARRARVLGENA